MPLATGNDMIEYYSPVTLGGLCSDSTTAISAAQLPSNSVMLRMLKSATGEVKAALLKSNRYTIEGIEALRDAEDDTTFDTDSDAFLRELVCRLTFTKLVQRKPWNDQHKAAFQEAQTFANEKLEQLENGTLVLNIAGQKTAGTPSSTGVDSQEPTSYWNNTLRSRFYPARRSTS